ncbi:MAG: serine/threonine protein kinase [Nannocystaceae bacterium]|nr:serine/threonine protein kinase [Nannocystaceae bacterium]
MAATDERLEPLVRAAAAATHDEHVELSRVAAALFEATPVAARFGRYRPVRVIGAGGLGEVLLAHDPELDRPVAIKSIARRLDPEARARLQARMRREAQALARLRHPNVVAVYDVGVADDGVFLAMEYVDGLTLSQWLAAAPHSVDEIVGVIIEAGRGLAAAHAAGVIHRDVKPSNILVDREGRARVVDFGLAFADADPRIEAGAPPSSGELTQTGALLGTPPYMAPEQFLGADVDARADQWGLAVTLHEALAGRRPFVGSDLAATRTAVLEQRYEPPEAPAPIRAALQRALQRDPDARFGDTLAFVAALAPTRRRWRLPLLLAGGLAVGGGALWWQRPVAGEASDPAAAVQVGELWAQWSTPNAIRWAWSAEGEADALRDYELVVGPSEDDVRVRSDRCRVFTRADNPELGHFLLPRTGGADPVRATITDGHVPEQVVFAQLWAIDTAGRRHGSNVASIHTAAPAVAQVVIFADQRPHGFSIPALEVVDTRPFAGTHHLQFVSRCEPPACFANLRWQDLDVDLSRVTPGDFATTAFLELAVAVDGDATSWWSQLRLWYDAEHIDRVGHFASFALRHDGEYRLLQVPLRAFEFRDGVEPAAQLRHGLFELGLGGWWPPGATVRIDEIRVRW